MDAELGAVDAATASPTFTDRLDVLRVKNRQYAYVPQGQVIPRTSSSARSLGLGLLHEETGIVPRHDIILQPDVHQGGQRAVG